MKLWLFAAVALLQLAVPAAMIRDAEKTLSECAVLRLRTAPVDPADLFRGRYVRLSYEGLRAKAGDETNYRHDERVYVSFSRDADGFSRPEAVWSQAPGAGEKGHDYVVARMRGFDPDTQEIEFEIAADRFYMDETLAPSAERAYAESGREQRQRTWVDLRVREGHALIEEVYIDGVPLAQVAREASQAPPAPR